MARSALEWSVDILEVTFSVATLALVLLFLAMQAKSLCKPCNATNTRPKILKAAKMQYTRILRHSVTITIFKWLKKKF